MFILKDNFTIAAKLCAVPSCHQTKMNIRNEIKSPHHYIKIKNINIVCEGDVLLKFGVLLLVQSGENLRCSRFKDPLV